MPLPVWTSTKDKFDKGSEDAYLNTQQTFARLAESRLDSVSADALDLKGLFKASTSLKVGPEFVTKVMPEALKVCESGLDLELRHVLLEYTGEHLKVYAGSSSKLMVFKVNVDMDEAEGDEPFRIALSVEHMRDMLHFLTKVFGTGVCRLGAKVNNYGTPEALLISCYSQISEDNPSSKVALFKMPRHIGDSPLPLMISGDDLIANAPVRYTATVMPAIRWIFSNKVGYIEFVHTNGILEAQFKNADGTSVRASLGAMIQTNADLPDPTSPLAALNDADMLPVFTMAGNHPIQIDIWFVETEDGDIDADKIRLSSKNFTAYIAQSYKVGIPAAKAYIAKVKGKIATSTAVDATEAAMKRNKIGKADRAQAMAAFKSGEVAPPADDDVIHAAITAVEVEAEWVNTEESVITMTQPSPEEVIEIVAPEPAATEIAEIVKNTEAVLPRVDVFKKADSSEDVNDKILKCLNSIDERLSILESKILTRHAPTKVNRAGIGTAEHELLTYLRQCPGEYVRTDIIKQICVGVGTSTMHLTLHKFTKSNVLIRVTRGRYFVPADIEERVPNYLAGVPNTDIILPEGVV